MIARHILHPPPMDRTERAIFDYLTHQGFTNIIYEPDGQVPPDFSIDGQIAVEARRLDQNVKSVPGARSLEHDARPLLDLIRKTLASIGPPTAGVSWFVCYRFRRPLPPWKQLRRTLRDRLRDCVRRGVQDREELEIAPGLSLTFYRAGTVLPTLLVLGASTDHDSGGFVVGEIARNLRICIDDKTRKIAPFRQRYPAWWLTVVDRIGFADLTESDLSGLRRVIQVPDPWQRIILVSPFAPTRGVEL